MARVAPEFSFTTVFGGIHSMNFTVDLHTYAIMLYIYALTPRRAPRRRVYEGSTPQCDS
jgi:hypothetical protein